MNLEQTRRAARWIFFMLFFTYGYFFQAGQDNENARFDQVRNIVESQRLDLMPYAGNSADVIVYEHKVYPNKAPGLTVLALPAWFGSTHFLSLIPLPKAVREHFACYLTTWLTIGLLSAFLGMVIFQVALRMSGDPTLAFLLTLAHALGTIAFPFSTLFFSHQMAAALLFFAFALLFEIKTLKPYQDVRSRLLAAGFLCGLAVATEYPAGIGMVALLVYAAVILKDRRMNAWFWVGLATGGGILVAYNLVAFGKIYFIPYSVYAAGDDSAFPEHKIGFMGVTFANYRNLLQITFLPQRGLFFCNPWLILLIPALCTFFCERKFILERTLCAVMVVGFLLFNAGYGKDIVFWGGGASVGPRHIIPMLPFAACLIAPLLKKPGWLAVFCLLAITSMAIMLMATATEPRVPYEYENPVRSLFWDNYRQGHLALHYRGTFSSKLLTRNSVSFNWGKLFRLPGTVELLPLLLFWLWAVFGILKTLEAKRFGFRYKLLSWGFLVFILVVALVPMPHALATRRHERSGHGLRGMYFNHLVWNSVQVIDTSEKHFSADELARTVAINRIDPTLVFNWDENGPPLPGQFSVQWTGYLEIPQGGYYGFGTQSDDGSSVVINQHLIVDNWGEHAMSLKQGSMRLEKGVYPIEVRYFNSAFGSGMVLLWQPPGGHLQPIPTEYLTPPR